LRQFVLRKKQNFASAEVSLDPLADSIVGRQVAADHEQEWIESGVDPVITRLNVQTLVDSQIDSYTHEVTYPIAERLNWKVTNPSFARQRSAQNLRGWWVNGVDPLNDWQPMLWGRFKPDGSTPIIDRVKGKPAKYLSPSLGKGSSRLVLLDVPLRIWQKIADRYQMQISRKDLRQGFWHWVWKSGVPIVLTEGEKKAGCLLTAGYVAISLPGIFGGYRREGNRLIPELAFFATAGRCFHICFDYETKPLVAHNIFLATCRLGQLLTRLGCEVQVMTLPGPEKGVDDLIVTQGAAVFDRLYREAQEWSLWQTAKLWDLTHPVTVELNQPYLGDLVYPETGLAFVKSAKGTGKTTALKGLVQRAIAQDRKVLVITHRIQLGRAICDSVGIDWITDRQASDSQEFHGFGLCIDSLHPNSQAKFDPMAWDGAIVILDEVEQVVWHAMNSATCYNARVRILETLKELLQHVLLTGGLVLAQDADLSDISVNYLKQLAISSTESFAIELSQLDPWVVVNRWQKTTTHSVSVYDTKTPAALLSKLPEILQQGAVFIALDSQKVRGRWSSKNLETYLQKTFPDKRILRIDSETVSNSEHAAFGISHRINEVVAQYDIVLATPTIGTGVSIDLKGHFKAVFGIFQGVIADTEARQAIARVREDVPRYLWAAKFGPGKIGNGSCFYRDLAQSKAKSVKYNIMLLREVDFDLDQQSDPIALRTWAKMAARVNLSLWQFRDSLKNGMRREGQLIRVVTDDPMKLLGVAELMPEQVQDLMTGRMRIPGYEFLAANHDLTVIEQIQQTLTQVRSANQKAEAEAVASSPEINPEKFEEISEKSAKTNQQRNSKRKHELRARYAVSVTPELTMKDEHGWYQQLLLHYYVTHDPLFVELRDTQEWQIHLERGAGKVALQDIQLFTAQVEMLKAMGVLELLDVDRKIRATDEEIQRIARLGWEYRQDVRVLFNIRVTEKTPPMTFVQALLAKMDLKLTAISRDRAPDGRRGGQRVYRFFPPEDDRMQIFEQWELRDCKILESVKPISRKQRLMVVDHLSRSA
jgi:ATP:corrinoid adenosyltransferase